MNLKDRTIVGIIWNGFGRFVIQGLQILILIVLARILTPSDFGIVGIAAIFTRLITLLNEIGIASAVVQRLEIDKEDLSTLFVASLVSGIVLTGIMLFVAQYLALFFDVAVLQPVLQVLSITLIIGAASAVQKALCNRKLDFRQLAIFEACGMALYGIVSIVLALSGFGIWSIIYGTIANHLVCSVLFWIKSDWKPQFMFYFDRFKKLVDFGLIVLLTRLVNYVGINLASFVTGKFLGPAMLGLYSLANDMSSMTVGRITNIIGRVMFPTLSKMQDDNERFNNAYLKVLQFISIISFPLLVGMAVLAEPLILIVFGEKWRLAIFPLQALASIGILRSIGSSVGFVLLSKGRSDIELKWNLFYLLLFFAVLFFTAKFGLNALVMGIVAVNLVGIPIIQKITFSLIGLTFARLFMALGHILVCSILMGFAVYSFYYLLNPFSGDVLNFVFAIILGIVSYVLFLWGLVPGQMREMWSSLSDSIFMRKLRRVNA